MAIQGLSATNTIDNDVALNSIQQRLTKNGLNFCASNICLLNQLLKSKNDVIFSTGTPIYDMSCLFINSDMLLTIENKPIIYVYKPTDFVSSARYKIPMLLKEDLTPDYSYLRMYFEDFEEINPSDIKQGVTKKTCDNELQLTKRVQSGVSLNAPAGTGTGAFTSIDYSLMPIDSMLSNSVRLPYTGKVIFSDENLLGRLNFGYIGSNQLNLTDSNSLFILNKTEGLQYKWNLLTGTLTETSLPVEYFAMPGSGEVVIDSIRYWLFTDSEGIRIGRLDLRTLEFSYSSDVVDTDTSKFYSLLSYEGALYIKLHGADDSIKRVNKSTVEIEAYFETISGALDMYFEDFVIYNHGENFIIVNTTSGLGFEVTSLKDMSSVVDIHLCGYGAPVVLNGGLNFVTYKDYNFFDFGGMKHNFVLVSDESSFLLSYGDSSSDFNKRDVDALESHQLFNVIDVLNV